MRTIFRDESLQAQFERRGFVTLPFLSEREAALLAGVWQELDTPVHSLNFSASVMSDDQDYRRRVSREIGAAFSEKISVLLSDYRFSFGNFIAKRAGATEGIPIHQDATFVDETRFESINFWVTLAAVGRENGCLRVMPGSHVLNTALRGTNRRFPYPQLEALIEQQYLVDVAMPVGWACIMNQRTFHTSYANRSAMHRVCASALAVPAESELYYLYEEMHEPDSRIHVYEVDDEFYRLQVFGAPASGMVPITRAEACADPIDVARLHAAFERAQHDDGASLNALIR